MKLRVVKESEVNNKSQGSSLRKPKTRVLLVDDHPILRKGLAQMINLEADMMVCAEAEDGPKAFELAGSATPDVAVIDVCLKGGNGIELVKNLKARFPDLPTLVLSMYDESLYAERALRAGSLGYIMKEEAIEQVLVAIRRVLQGEIFLSDKMKAKVLQQLATGKAKTVMSPIEALTDRELEILRMIGAGRSVKEIAQALFLSAKTVESHREHIKDKLNVKSSAGLLRFAIENTSEGRRT